MRRLLALVLLVAALLFGFWLWRRHDQPRLYQYTGFAFDTVITLTWETTPDDAEWIRMESLDRLRELERMLQPGGTLEMALATQPVALPEPQWLLPRLAAVDTLVRASHGAFDPTVKPLLDAWGLWSDSAPAAPPDPSAIRDALTRVGWSRVRITLASASLDAEAGTEIYCGAIAKGWALDDLVALWRSYGVTRGVIDLGGDLAILGSHPSGRGWRIGIQDPFDPRKMAHELERNNCFIATSGDYERGFDYRGVRYHHILDPHTGYPTRGVHSVTVIARDGFTADALATALFVMGKADALKEDYDYRALLIGDAGKEDRWRWDDGNLPSPLTGEGQGGGDVR